MKLLNQLCISRDLSVFRLLPAFEAVRAAARQGDEAAWGFNWIVRHAFFAESRTICMRHELVALAQDAGLETEGFLRDWDTGSLRESVVTESHRGWEELKVRGSPTFVLPSGTQVWNPGAIGVKFDRHYEVVERTPADCPDGDCIRVFRDLLESAISQGAA